MSSGIGVRLGHGINQVWHQPIPLRRVRNGFPIPSTAVRCSGYGWTCPSPISLPVLLLKDWLPAHIRHIGAERRCGLSPGSGLCGEIGLTYVHAV